MADENLLKMAEQKFQSAAEKIAKDLIATCYKEQQTNAERISAMSDEELVEFIGHNSLCDRVQGESGNWCNDHNCTDCLQEWLKQPAEE